MPPRSKEDSLTLRQTHQQWDDIADEWRVSYLQWTRSIAADPSKAWKTVDEHNIESLREIFTTRGLISAFDDAKIKELALVWHKFGPWPDTNRGLEMMNERARTCTLSNGNIVLLQDMVKHSAMPFTDVYSAEMFQSYKPNPKVYLGAAEKMGLEPGDCAMVAAHFNDLKAAKGCGFKTIYVWRSREERNPEMEREASTFVDIMVKEGEQGFITAAERLGS